jgi:hypothetical protein
MDSEDAIWNDFLALRIDVDEAIKRLCNLGITPYDARVMVMEWAEAGDPDPREDDE